jgi:predicted aldo/keto reductase-like oxidoreductase
VAPQRSSFLPPAELPRHAPLDNLGPVCRLGLASRGNTHLSAEAVLEALSRGVDYLNWCGHSDGMSAAIRKLGERRPEVRVAVQLEAREADDARDELRAIFVELNVSYIDVVTYYYVEHPDEWDLIQGPGGAAEVLRAAQAEGKVRMIGLTSHQRAFAAGIAGRGEIDLLMVRYNAAHRGAENDVFPVALERQVPVVAFTALRWGALLDSTPDDPADFVVPPAPDWYRFSLCHPAVSVVLAAPDSEEELAEDLSLLDDWRPPSAEEYANLIAHGERVRRHAGRFL